MNIIIYFLKTFSEKKSLKSTIDKLQEKYDENFVNSIIVYSYTNGLISGLNDYYVNTKEHYVIQYVDKYIHITEYGYNFLASYL